MAGRSPSRRRGPRRPRPDLAGDGPRRRRRGRRLVPTQHLGRRPLRGLHVGGRQRRPEDDNATSNVFVRDLAAGTMKYVNRADGIAGTPASAGAFIIAISADGQRVAFDGPATLFDPTLPAFTNIFLRNVGANTTTLVSRAGGAGGAIGDSSFFQPSMSADAGVIVYEFDLRQPLVRGERGRLGHLRARPRDEHDDARESRGRPRRRGRQRGLLQPDGLGERPLRGVPVGRQEPFARRHERDDVFVRDLGPDARTVDARSAAPPGRTAPSGTASRRRHACRPTADTSLFDSEADNLSTEDDKAVSNVFVRDS